MASTGGEKSLSEEANPSTGKTIPAGDEVTPPGLDMGRIRAYQVREVSVFTPMIMAANAFSSMIFTYAAWPNVNRLALICWLVFVYVLLARVTYSWFRNLGNTKESVSASLTGKAIFWGSIQGFSWALVPALFFVGQPGSQQNLILAILLVLSCSGALGLIHVPRAAYAYAGLMLSAMTVALIVEGGSTNQLLAALCAGYSAIGYFGTKHHARIFRQRAVSHQQLAHQREVIHLLLKDFESSNGDWLWETDTAGRITTVSESFNKIVGIDGNLVIGRKLTELCLNRDNENWQELNHVMAERKAVTKAQVPVNVRNAERWWCLSAQPRFNREEEFLGYLGVASDVTEARKAEEAMMKAKEAAESANAAKSKFLAVLSHELRSPLNAVIGFSEIIAEQSFGEISIPKYAEYAGEIRDSSRHLLAIINDMLDIARIESGAIDVNQEEFLADELFDGITRLMGPMARKRNVTLQAETGPTPVHLLADPRLVRQILINLVTNAIKFTPEGGSVTVGSEVDKNGSVSLWVRDTGIGIAKEDQAKVFEPFSQVDTGHTRSVDGVGLGLSIAVHLARAHGGELSLESEIGEGTTVGLTLPNWRVVHHAEGLVA